jgi:uncharacterized membrane protein YjgN (DUF898 family)
MAVKKKLTKKAAPKRAPVKKVAIKRKAIAKARTTVKPLARLRAAASEGRWGFGFSGTGGELFVLWLANQLLNTLSLGIYKAWARAKEYTFFYGHSLFQGRPFQFHGTGREIFKGYLIAWLFLTLLYFAFAIGFILLFVAGLPVLSALFGQDSAGWGFVTLLLGALVGAWLGLGWLVEQAHFRSRKFRARRVSYNGIRLGLAGRPGDFTRDMLVLRLKVMASLFLWYPRYLHERMGWVYRGLRFGQLRFDYDADLRDWARLWWRGLGLTLLSFGIYGFWWWAAQKRFIFSHLRLGPDRFHLDMDGGSYLRLQLLNALLVIGSLGIGYAWAKVRVSRYYAQRLSLLGPLDPEAAQAAAMDDSGASGEGMEAALDMDMDWGF